jgi:hypothetical protein
MPSPANWMLQLLAGTAVTDPIQSGQAVENQIDQMYQYVEPWSLGMPDTRQTAKRSRMSIYTLWAQMARDPTIAAALTLHITAALGSHESRGDCIFITPSQLVRDKTGKRAKKLQELVEQESKSISTLINRFAFTLMRRGVQWGDDFARVYTKEGEGVTWMLVDEHTAAPNVEAYEQGGKTVGFHMLEFDRNMRIVTKLTTRQMIRLKMPRITNVPQTDVVYGILRKLLSTDELEELPIIPAKIGGSMLYDAEEAYQKMTLLLTALNSQQVADSVKQGMLGIDMSGMPPEQRRVYKKNLEATLQASRNFVESAMMGGSAIYGTQYSFMPTWGEKQVVNPLGELAGRSGGQVSIEPLMIAVRRLTASLGIDMSMLGWSDMLTGGLGDGAAFHTSAQVAQRSVMMRQAMTDFCNDVMQLHFEVKYGIRFDEHQLPWQIEYFSDVSASTTEAESNRMTRMNSLALTSQSLGALKELGLDKDAVRMLLEDVGGMDFDKADALATALTKEPPMEGSEDGGNGGMTNDEEAPTPTKNEAEADEEVDNEEELD